jgi:hypothetical protein
MMLYFLSRGHGPLWDLATDENSSILTSFYNKQQTRCFCMPFTSSFENVKVNGEF